MPLDPFYILCAVVAVVISGLAKGGFSAAGSLAMPILALAIDPVRAAAILLPILIVQDVVGVWAFRRTWDGHVLAVMIPGMTIGVALGYFFSAQVSADVVLGVLGAISILFGLQRLWVERGHAITLPSNSPAWLGALFGVASGFTSHIAHAGSPPFQMWVLPRKLPRDTLVGTTAIAFAVMNWIKVPAYTALGQFTRANLLATGVLIPLALISTMLGVKLVRKVDPERFYVLIYVLMILLGMKLLADALI
ncbi:MULTISPECIES: sulfite exporter TauE/SafE family protein [unclassified Sphingobium]|uniref:sulfite exporter TauE/SafE family protein n=1 Tax=unclassified Sphingobium TaxID=2611147 RepID=UPI0022247811|nr:MULTISPECIES: sulfite exporter TauE/SafE family protein [unclassified Sphingobium]MCW2394940.1 putative membrane protein YfcA [Sphingobium sp. B8D3B]MCW2418454.1 putative membrane protein YfcA [Sphingobium sp. B8D3C]